MKVMKLAVMAAALATGIVNAGADQTNVVENIQIHLQGLKQGDTRTAGNTVVVSVDSVRIENRHVIQALGAATGNAFSQSARLVLVTPQDGGFSSVQVRDGGASVDVTGYFAIGQVGSSVTTSVTNTKNGRSAGATYSIYQVALQDAGGALSLHFAVSGMATDYSVNRPSSGADGHLSIDAAGNGDQNGVPMVIQGSIKVSGQTLEVVPGDDGGGPPNV